MPKNTSLTKMTTDMLASALSAQAVGMELLLAEMRALSEVMPGCLTLPGALTQMPALAKHVAAAEDADFDNMPV